jgi:hypothetical protein
LVARPPVKGSEAPKVTGSAASGSGKISMADPTMTGLSKRFIDRSSLGC